MYESLKRFEMTTNQIDNLNEELNDVKTNFK
jgi:hypothetical protein